MKFSEIVEQLVIDPRKLTEYALNPNHPDGKDKAVVFAKVLGFTKENYQELLQQLATKAMVNEAIIHRVIAQGTLYKVEVPVEGVTGRQATVITGWLVQPDTSTARLVTLRVKTRR